MWGELKGSRLVEGKERVAGKAVIGVREKMFVKWAMIWFLMSSASKSHSPRLFLREDILLDLLLLMTEAWKKAVFWSPKFNQSILDLEAQKSSIILRWL